MALRLAVLAACLVAAWAQQQQVQRTTPVPILKQINRQNEDGSYSYGYESADGTFKIETKYPTGEVYGKYGYVDADGKVRTVEYGASKKGGFNPAGTDINVPPPTLVNNNNLADSDYDDGSYREDPSIYYKNDPNSAPAAPVQQAKPLKARFNNAPVTQAPAFRPQQQFSSQQTTGQSLSWSAPAQSRTAWSAPVAQPQPQPQPQFQPQPQPQPQVNWAQPSAYAPPNYDLFRGHPAANIDPITGSYSLQYVG